MKSSGDKPIYAIRDGYKKDISVERYMCMYCGCIHYGPISSLAPCCEKGSTFTYTPLGKPKNK